MMKTVCTYHLGKISNEDRTIPKAKICYSTVYDILYYRPYNLWYSGHQPKHMTFKI